MSSRHGGDPADTSDVGVAISPREAQSATQILPDLVSVEHFDSVIPRFEFPLEKLGNRRFSSSRQSGEPNREPFLQERTTFRRDRRENLGCRDQG